MIIGIIGLGLIGGSIVKAVKSRTLHTVYGSDINPETMLMARMCGSIDGEFSSDNAGECDLIFIALRPSDCVEWMQTNAHLLKKGAAVIDLCGVKRAVCDDMHKTAEKNGLRYIGGHPMAGKERGGFVNSSPELFCGASMILVPMDDTLPDLLEQLDRLFTDLGFSRVVYTNAAEHDRVIAFTSQLAHIVSGAYVKSPEAQNQRGFSAGSFQDMTRVAYLDENMWTELFLDNADHLTTELDVLIGHLTEYRNAIKDKNENELRRLLKDGREKKASAGGC